jgi:hypothetical protein
MLVLDHQKLFNWCFPLVICYSIVAATFVLAFMRGGLLQLQAAFPVYTCVFELCGVVSCSQHPLYHWPQSFIKLKQGIWPYV